MKEKVNVLHFVYICIIALLIIVSILVYVFGGNEDAGNQVNVMATGISIVLGVIAIFMTLADVAGQRQSITEIKETAKKLTDFQELAQEKITELLLALEKVDDLKNTMKNNTSELKNFTENVLKEEFEVQGTISNEQLKEIHLKLNNKYNEINQRFKKIDMGSTKDSNSIQKKKSILKFRKWVKATFPESDTEDYSAFLDEVYNSFNIADIKFILPYLRESGVIYTYDNSKVVDVKYIKNVPPQYL
ncbi:hypothetical protein [Bacillus sp. FSL W8-0629]|uniref:hypothetical protein n=1 Tax=Bacillus sp. FSL W8-0629 TaxID=2954626 RepID=UPI00315925BD